MDISGVSAAGAVSAALAQKQVYSEQEAGVAMLKKAIDSQAANALALVNSVPAPPNTQSLPTNLGQNINTTV